MDVMFHIVSLLRFRVAIALFLLYKSASGYALLEAHGLDEIGHNTEAVRNSVSDLNRFGKVVKCRSFNPFNSFNSYCTFTPTTILASIILSALPGLIDINEAYKIWKVDKLDFLACVGAFFGVLFASVEVGLLVAIQEEREFDELSSKDRISHSRSTPTPHPSTPIVHKHTKSKKKRSDSEKDGSISCNKCRPHSCNKIFILHLDPIIMATFIQCSSQSRFVCVASPVKRRRWRLYSERAKLMSVQFSRAQQLFHRLHSLLVADIFMHLLCCLHLEIGGGHLDALCCTNSFY
ncbi:hypothetical protein JHK82_040277 [Glycine max]|nr:hypothetical protein JHK82_040277 [Glycine max]